MKKGVIALLISGVAALFFMSCAATPKTTAHGKENVAYLQLASTSAYVYKDNEEGESERTPRVVTVIIDDTAPFEAKVNDGTKRTTDYEFTYKIAVGAHDIVVKSGDTVIATKKVFTSANQVKIVEVP